MLVESQVSALSPKFILAWMKADLDEVESDFSGRLCHPDVASGDGQTSSGSNGWTPHSSDDGYA
jgi:hypothetical protein